MVSNKIGVDFYSCDMVILVYISKLVQCELQN